MGLLSQSFWELYRLRISIAFAIRSLDLSARLICKFAHRMHNLTDRATIAAT